MTWANSLEDALSDLCEAYFPGPAKSRELVQRVSGFGAQAVSPLIAALRERTCHQPQLAVDALVQIGEPAVPALAQMLCRHDEVTGPHAVEALRGIGTAAALDAIKESLRRQIEAARRRQRLGWIRIGVFACVGVAVLFLVPEGLFKVIQIVGPLIGGGIAVDVASNLRRGTAAALTNCEDVRMVSVLALCLADSDRSVRYSAATALKRLLPRLQASDRDTITVDGMESLLRELQGKDEPLMVAIIRALEQVGDERAVPIVERLASSADTNYAVKRAALEALPALWVSAKRAAESRTLLRAASAPDDAPLSLLRPAASAGESAPERLLRPGVGPAGERAEQ